MTDALDPTAYRLLARLAARETGLVQDSGGYRLNSPRPDNRPGRIDPDSVSILLARGLIAPGDRAALRITAAGSALVRRRLAGADGFAAQHQERGTVTLDDPDFGRRRATVNHDESPLAWLRRRKDRNGRPMIGADEFTAGERLRADHERARLMPRVTANWTATVAGKRRSGGGNNGMADLTDSALAARRRVEAALNALGPELAGLAVDFCCFLKGLEQIERERQWPARSAKVVLRLALAALARHYGLAARAKGPRSSGVRHWGAEGYRPTID